VRTCTAVLALCLLAGCSIGGDDDERRATDASQFVADLTRQDQEEGEFGSVGLSAAGTMSRVIVEVLDPPPVSQEVEIRSGNCQVVGSAVTYRLAPLDNGISETVVNVPLRTLRRMGYLVMVRDSGAPIGGLCADLAQAQPPSAAPTFD
jgi:hypothetical protein